MKLKFTLILFLGFLFNSVSTAQDAGSTSDALDVSLTGGASYSIPIAIPPGINGVEPTISLAFNSQAGNGLAGYGWNIGGLSTITRVSSTLFHDGEIDPIDFDEKDRFALDGQRLLLKSGSYGANGTRYQTENYSNIKIRSVGVSTYGAEYGPKYFVVHYPDGSRGFYGNATNSRGRLEWALYKWQDTQGNFIRYSYARSGELLRIANIYYGSRGSASPPNRIKFVYADRLRPEQSYIGGISFTRSKILRRIEVTAGGQLYRKYELTHNPTSMGYQRVEKIQESNGINGQMPPINFDYTSYADDVKRKQIATRNIDYDIDSNNTRTILGDFNSDGQSDLVFYDLQDNNSLHVYEDLDNYNGRPDKGWEHATDRIDYLFTRTALDQNNKLMSKQGITVVSDTYISGITSRLRFTTYSVNSDETLTIESSKSWDAPVYLAEYNCDDTFRLRTTKRFVTGDFNGDGITDAIALTFPYTETICNPVTDCDPNDPQPIAVSSAPTGSTSTAVVDCCECTDYQRTIANSYFIDLDRRKTSNFANYTGQIERAISYEDRILAADFNGDGVSELVHISPGRVEVYGLENGILNLIHSLQDPIIDRTKPILPGDYNGDGKIDFAVAIEAGTSNWRFFMSTGALFIPNTRDIGLVYNTTYYYGNSSSEYNYINQDFNSDGKTDILKHNVFLGSTYQERFQLYTSANISNGFPVFENTIDESFYDGGTQRYGIPLLFESSVSNQNIEYAYISGRGIDLFEFTKDLQEDTRLNSIRNNGVQTLLDYNVIRRHPDDNFPGGTYYRDEEELYPYVNINNALGLEVVNELERKGAGYVQKRDFKYRGAVSHAQGLGFLGFKQSYSTNWYGDGVTQLWTTTKTSPQLRGAAVLEWSANFFSHEPSNYISKTDYDYKTINLANKVFVNVPNTVTVEDALNGFTSTQSFVYDTNYEITRTTSSNSGGTLINDFTYFNNLNSNNQNYHVGRPKNKKTSSTIGGNTFYSEEEYTYNQNLVNTVKRRGQGTEWITEAFTRDLFGNMLTKTLSAPGLAPRTETYAYDASGRYLLSSTDIEGLESSFTYDTRTGNLLTSTDPYNRSASYTYDGWDRPITETNYLGKVATTTYTNTFEGGFEQSTLYEGGGGNKERYNAFGWITRSETLSLNGKWIVSTTQYDTAGRLTQVYEPYFSDENSGKRTSTSYDEYGRPISIINYTGEVHSISYDGLMVTVDDGTKLTTTTANPFGNILEITDPGGTVNYSYHGNGMIKTADYGGQIVETTIDVWGRKIRLVDPSAGTYTYDYNLYGELTADTTPKGGTTYTLDGLGKLIQKDIQGDETNMVLTYTYDGADKLLRNVNAVNTGGGRTYNYSYDYDSYKRPNELIETNPFARFEVSTTYDGFGRPLRQTYDSRNLTDATTSNITVQNRYDTESGMLDELRNDADNQRLWRLDAHDSQGQVTRTTLGNGFRQVRNYDDYGLPKTVRDIKGSGSTRQNALRVNYSFDAQRGVLDNRRNIDLNWTENFTYDQLDRLTTITGAVQKTQAYDNRGRITGNTDIGDYSYGSDKIYRLAGLDLNDKGGGHYRDKERREITYNAFKKPTEIFEEDNGRVSFGYTPMMQRSHAWYGGLEEDKEQRRFRKHYSSISPVEIVEDRQTGDTKIMTYLGGDQYSATVVHIETKNNSVDGFHYLHRDYLGSILAITDSNSTLVEQTQFGAWGAVDRHLTNGTEAEFGHDSLLGRGYTGHEHFFSVSLIHMNGRMYDADLGRFLSPDNHIQNPYNSQNFDRYGYVLNNPLIYSDPSGNMTEDGGGISDGTASLAVNLAVTLIQSVDWKSVGNWFGNVGRGISNGIRNIGRSFRSLFTKSREAATLIVSENRINLNPAIRSKPNLPSWLTSKGGVLDSFLTYGNYQRGAYYGFAAGGQSTWELGKSLTTPQGWKNMGQGFVNLAHLGNMYSPEGAILRGQMGVAAENFINRVPHMDAFELGHHVGYGVEKVTEGVLLTRGTTLAVNGLRSVEIVSTVGKRVSVIGPRSIYREFARKRGANFLDVIDEAWSMRKNVKFLQGVVKRGDDVLFAGNYSPVRLDPSSVLAQEIRYLIRHGYYWTDDFTRLVKK